MKDQKIQEITLLEVDIDKIAAFEKANAVLRKAFSKRKGYYNSYSYRSINQKNIFLEIIEWNSLEEARKATRVFGEENLGSYINAIQSVKYFDYTTSLSISSYNFEEIGKEEIVEFAYAHTDNLNAEHYYASQQMLSNYLQSKYDALQQSVILRSALDPVVFVDLSHWKDIQTCHKAQKELENHELFQNVLQYMDLNKEFMMDLFYRAN